MLHSEESSPKFGTFVFPANSLKSFSSSDYSVAALPDTVPKYSIGHCSKILTKPLNLKSQGLANLALKTKFIYTRYNHKRKKAKTQSNRKVLIARRYLQRKNSEVTWELRNVKSFTRSKSFKSFNPNFTEGTLDPLQE